MPHLRSGGRRLGTLAVALLLAAAFVISGCEDRMSGVYALPNGTGSMEFKTDGTVYVEMLGMIFAGEYTVDEQRIIIKGPNGSQVYTLNGDHLEGGLGMVFIRQ